MDTDENWMNMWTLILGGLISVRVLVHPRFSNFEFERT
jgi:hypothetical protein